MAKNSGRPNTSTAATLILLNKPNGFVSQFSGDDRNLSQLISVAGVYPAGRLDKDSEGLLLLTDNGTLQHRISHPQHKLTKSYWVQVEGEIDASALQQLISGVVLKDGPASALSATAITEPANLWPRDPPVRVRNSIPTSWLDISINEGRNRQIRRMTAAAGFPTLRLIRHCIGEWSLSDIASGQYQTKILSATEIRHLSGVPNTGLL
ncbi:pseudouridine synthase [Chromatiales bacterium (ex Bugula neritina AB1)]|nr:pseudouridine synthase [Chromatiales bacterium (ex Bugula neritina AB1)]